METLRTKNEMQRRARELRRAGRRIGLVPTMGALHVGHLSLLHVARPGCDVVVTSIFVNPLQFGPREDLARYPRDLEGDLDKLREVGCDLVFTPEADDLLGAGRRTHVEVEGWSDVLCGASRPGHFRGVATIVLKLFHVVTPHVAVFGLKDAQQALILRRMTHDLDLDIELRFAPTQRDPDGLAMSSRNAYLAPSDRREALRLHEALQGARALIENGERDASVVVTYCHGILSRGQQVTVDYVQLVDVESLQPLQRIEGSVLLALAARVGETRLIDNVLLQVDGGRVADLRLEA